MSFLSEHNSLPTEKKRHIVCSGCLFFLKHWYISLYIYSKLKKRNGSTLYNQVIVIKVTFINCEVSKIYLKLLSGKKKKELKSLKQRTWKKKYDSTEFMILVSIHER